MELKRDINDCLMISPDTIHIVFSVLMI